MGQFALSIPFGMIDLATRPQRVAQGIGSIPSRFTGGVMTAADDRLTVEQRVTGGAQAAGAFFEALLLVTGVAEALGIEGTTLGASRVGYVDILRQTNERHYLTRTDVGGPLVSDLHPPPRVGNVTGDAMRRVNPMEGGEPVPTELLSRVEVPNVLAARAFQEAVEGTPRIADGSPQYRVFENDCISHCGDAVRAAGRLDAPTTTPELIPWLRKPPPLVVPPPWSLPPSILPPAIVAAPGSTE